MIFLDNMPRTGVQFAKEVHAALQTLGKDPHAASPLGELLLYEQLCAQPSRSGRRVQPSLEVFLRRALRAFKTEQPAQARLLIRRFLEHETAKEVAHSQLISQETVNRNQQRAIAFFASWLQAQEQEARTNLLTSFEANLPPASFGRLFGVEKARSRLAGALQARRPPWVLCLTGAGGIGKTALANQVVRSSIPTFSYRQVIWLQARHDSPLTEEGLLTALSRRMLPVTTPAKERLPTLRRALQEQPALVVLDNLDAEVNSSDWVDWLHSLANPSKFLLCSRRRPAVLARAYSLPLDELPLTPSTELMLHQAKELGLESHLAAIQEQAASIYARTGGNPLALKLSVGLLHTWPLKTVLDALEERSGEDVESMYNSIFQASWDSLSRNGRRLLLAMPLVSAEGASPAQLKAISGLDAATLRSTIHELLARSLLELRGDPQSPRYGIHQLTLTFLSREILNEE